MGSTHDNYQFLIMNFGFCGTSSTFQNYINDILHQFLNIDDIFIYNKMKIKQKKYIRLIFQKIQKIGLQ